MTQAEGHIALISQKTQTTQQRALTGMVVVSGSEVYRPVEGVTPEQFFQELGKLRKEAEAEIERLIDWLDSFDAPSEDLEPTMGDIAAGQTDEAEPEADMEPSVSLPEMMNQEKRAKLDRWLDPRTIDCELDRADEEPSLGSGSVHETRSQTEWSFGGTDDREDEHDGRELPEDDEPSLGWTEAGCIATKGWGWDDGEYDGLTVADCDKARRRFRADYGLPPHGLIRFGLFRTERVRMCSKTRAALAGR